MSDQKIRILQAIRYRTKSRQVQDGEMNMSVMITRLSAVAVRVPLATPVLAPQLKISFRDYLLVMLECSDNSRGIGFSYIGTGGGKSTAAVFDEFVLQNVLGADPTNPEAISKKLKFATRIQGRGGIVANAFSALDIALWDRNSRAAGLPLAQMINPDAKKVVPAYASGGYLNGEYRPAELEREIKSALDAGFASIKLKCAFGSQQDDIARVKTARRFMGDKTNLMLDAYNRWTQVEDALPSVIAYQDVHPYWVEDPFEPDMIEELSGLNRQVGAVLATGEFYFSPAAFQAMASQKAVGVFQAEAPRCGGITDWLKIADIAQANGIEFSPCWFHDLHVHLVAASPAAKFVEYFPTRDILNFAELIDRPVIARDGEIAVPQEPGVGFDFIMDAVEKYALATAITGTFDTPTLVQAAAI
ncbi:hypothetical protein CSC3H3_21180 (plasmid) [Thalassospira marina]|uniref:Mandelate racemase/muconate lactonizing enzyme C-terminal domain-containing protein n=2 Tax=Thalassospira marina TaxID=2048283 RepID=A0ABM6QFT5_9PROT|nr:hypothetical protein CSC3H3_21180 [Thalassospira marina]